MPNDVVLYIATHNKTGLKYFGRTSRYLCQEDLQKYYHGSGVHWKNHLLIHGDDVTMEIYRKCSLNEDDNDFVKPIALKFSEENNIVTSTMWANLKLEDGFDGGSIGGVLHPCTGTTLSEDHKNAISIANKGKVVSEETKEKQRISKLGTTHSNETKEKMSLSKIGEKNSFYGETHSEETKEKLRYPKTEETKEKLRISQSQKLECPFCKKIGGKSAMRRWHFENCKLKGAIWY